MGFSPLHYLTKLSYNQFSRVSRYCNHKIQICYGLRIFECMTIYIQEINFFL